MIEKKGRDKEGCGGGRCSARVRLAMRLSARDLVADVACCDGGAARQFANERLYKDRVIGKGLPASPGNPSFHL